MTAAPTVACPRCGAAVAWRETSPWRPFCSARCKTIDLGNWAAGRYVIASDNVAETGGESGSPADVGAPDHLERR